MGQLLGNSVILSVSRSTHGISFLHERPSLYNSTADAAPVNDEYCLKCPGTKMMSCCIRISKQNNLSMLCRNCRLQRGINSLFVNEDCWCAACSTSAVPCLLSGSDLLSSLHPVMMSISGLHSHCCRSAMRISDRLHRYAEPTFEEEEEVLDGDFSGSMYGLIDNGKQSSSSAPLTQLDQALSRVRQELSMQLGRAGGDASLSSEVEAALSQVSGLASRLATSAKDLAQPASA